MAAIIGKSVKYINLIMKRIFVPLIALMALVLSSCSGSIDSKIDKLDSLCDDYVETLQKGRLHDAKIIRSKMDKYWDEMNELYQENKLTDDQNEYLNEIENRMFHAEYLYK